MAKRYGCYAEDMILAAKDMLIEAIRDTLSEYDPTEQDAKGVIAGIGGMVLMTDKFIEELGKERPE